MLTTYMNPQLTRLDVVTTEDGYLLTLNQVMELKKQKIEHVEAFIKEHKFKPIIMKKNRMEHSGTAGNHRYLSSLEWDTWRESSLPSELWLNPKEPLESILKVSMSLILSLN